MSGLMPVSFEELLPAEETISSANYDSLYPIEPSNGKPVVEHLQPVQPITPPPDDHTVDLSLPSVTQVPAWSLKSPEQWTPDEFASWLCWWGSANGVPDSELTYLLYEPLSGFELCALDHQFFIDMCPPYGLQIYEALHQMVNGWHSNYPYFERLSPSPPQNYYTGLENCSPINYSTYLFCDIDSPQHHKQDMQYENHHCCPVPPIESFSPPPAEDNSSHSLIINDEINDLLDEEPTEKTKTGKLWQFLRDLLSNPKTNPSMIKWVNKDDGRFKFVQCDKVAKLWGRRNFNSGMTYEKMSRAIRYYYKQQVLLPVPGQTHVYRFGPNAKIYVNDPS